MSEIKAGVTLMQDFCVSQSDEFQSYIDYMDREEAQRNQAFQTYSLFHDYMDNPEKSTGLFTDKILSLIHIYGFLQNPIRRKRPCILANLCIMQPVVRHKSTLKIESQTSCPSRR